MATKKRGGCEDEDGVGRYTARTSSHYLVHNGLLSCCSSLAAGAFEEGVYSATVITMSLTIYQYIHSSIVHSICRESNIITRTRRDTRTVVCGSTAQVQQVESPTCQTSRPPLNSTVLQHAHTPILMKNEHVEPLDRGQVLVSCESAYGLSHKQLASSPSPLNVSQVLAVCQQHPTSSHFFHQPHSINPQLLISHHIAERTPRERSASPPHRTATLKRHTVNR
jgi:hypothetical protein